MEEDRIRVEEMIQGLFNRVQQIDDPTRDGDAYEQVLQIFGLESVGDNADLRIYNEEEKPLQNAEAVDYAVQYFYDEVMALLVDLKRCDPLFSTWKINGGAAEDPATTNPHMVKMLDTLLAWPFVAMQFIQSTRAALMFSNNEIYDAVRSSEGQPANRSAPNIRYRFKISQHMRTMLSDKRLRSVHIICSSVLVALQENQYVLHNEAVWSRRKVPKRRVLLCEGQRVCRECGKGEAEHTLAEVCSRKPHVFQPMTLQCDTTERIDTHTYERRCTLEKFIYDHCGPSAHDLWSVLLEDKSAGKYVLNALLRSDWAPRMNIRRGLFALQNGLFDVDSNRFFPYTCQCHNIWYEGTEGQGYKLHGWPRRRQVAKSTIEPEKDVWLFKTEDGFYQECGTVPDDGSPTYCEECGAGCAPQDWVAQKMLSGFFDRHRYWTKMRGAEAHDMADIPCHVCGNSFDHDCHHPKCRFVPSQTDFGICENCGKPSDDLSHHPECKMWFSRSPFTSLITSTCSAQKCMSCRKEYDGCGCTMFMPFDFKPESTRNLEHTALSSMFYRQRIPDPVIDFYFVMLARTLLTAQQYDKFQVFVFIKGPAGNGKTTLIDLVVSFFNAGDTASIGNNAQEQFPLEQCIDAMTGKTKLLTYFGEIKSNCKVDATHFQKMADCEKNYPFNMKGKKVVNANIEFSLWLAGNEFFGTDQGDSLTRRAFILHFPDRIENSQQDAKLFERLTKREIGSILFHASMQFAFYKQKYPGASASFQNIVSDMKKETGCTYITDQQKSMMQSIQPMHMFLQQCINQGLKIVSCKNTEESKKRCYRKHNYVTWQRLTQAFKRFMGKTMILTEELYVQPFKHVGLIRTSVAVEREVWDPDNMNYKSVTANFVLGLRDMEGRADDDDDDELEESDEEEGIGEEIMKTIQENEKHLCDSNPAAFERHKSMYGGCYNEYAFRNMCSLLVERPDSVSSQGLHEIGRILQTTMESVKGILAQRTGVPALQNKRQRCDDDGGILSDDDDDI